MKTLKPQQLSVLHKTFENEGTCYFVLSIFALFPFDEPERLLPEVSLWKLALEELGGEQALDECMPKTHGEILVYGKAHPPGDEPQPVCVARVQLGGVDKTVYVVGHREWRRGVATDPEPFTAMEVSWRTAFGGEDYDLNPAGKGVGPITDEDGRTHHPLPNVEDPRKLVKAPKDRPTPVSFGAYPLTAPHRQQKAGTYDAQWLKTRFPGYAEDFDWTFFNVAAEDQQIDGFFAGGETFVLENLHPEQRLLEGWVPSVQARCFVTRRDGGGQLDAVPTRIDTVILLPNRRRGIVVFRGVTEVAEDDAADLEQLLVAAELPGAPRPLDHYRDVLEKRLDKEMGAVHSLRDGDLLPPRPAGAGPPDEAIADVEALIRGDGILKQRLRKRAERELDQVRQEVAAMGLDPAELELPTELPAEPKPPTLDETPEFVGEQLRLADQLKQDIEEKQAEAEAEIRQLCEEGGLDYDVVMAEAKRASGGPPDFSAAAELERLRDMATLGDNAGVPIAWVRERLADPELERGLQRAEDQLRDAYRRFAHLFPEAARLDADVAARVRVEVAAARAAGESLARRDLTGADLSGLDLGGADLRGSFLERASLAGANLSGADLTDAVLARADLVGANLAQAKLAGANLGGANLTDAVLSEGADLTDAVLAGANLTNLSLRGATLGRADLSEAVVVGADLSGATAHEMIVLRTDLSHLKLRGAKLTKCAFIESTLVGADFTGADLESTVLLKVKADEACFGGAKLINFRVVHDCTLPRADFRNAQAPEANFRGTDLASADFTGADLNRADFSECDLAEASFVRANARQSMFIRADLSRADMRYVDAMMAIMQKATVEGADFTGANLFRVDFAKIKGDDATEFEDANMNQIRFVDRGDHGQR